MKIVCAKCGKKYDTEMTMGLCPKCGYYNKSSKGINRELLDENDFTPTSFSSEPVPEESVWNEPVSSQAAFPQPVFPQPVSSQPVSSQPVSKKKWFGAIDAVLLLVMLVVFIINAVIVAPRRIEAAYQGQKSYGAEEKTVYFGESFTIGESQLEIQSILPFEIEGFAAPKGFQFVQIHYSFQPDEYGLYYLEELVPYLEFDGRYVEPLSVFSFPGYWEMTTDEQKKFDENEIHSYFETTGEGRFIFIIPTDVEETSFLISHLDRDTENEGNVKPLLCSYTVIEKEEK